MVFNQTLVRGAKENVLPSRGRSIPQGTLCPIPAHRPERPALFAPAPGVDMGALAYLKNMRSFLRTNLNTGGAQNGAVLSHPRRAALGLPWWGGPGGASAENPKCHKKGLFQSTGAHKEKESALHIGCSGFGMKIEFSILQWPQFLLSAHWQASFFSGLGCIFQLFWGSLFFCRGKEVTVLGMMLVVLVVVVVVGHSHL